MKEFEITHRQSGQRLDKYLAKVLPQASKSFLYKMLRKKNIELNKVRATGAEILKEHDRVQIWFSDETFAKFSQKLPARRETEEPLSRSKIQDLEIIYEDTDILVVNKPAGILSQKAKVSDYSMNEWILDWLLENNRVTTEELRDFTPSVCNRLDRNTTGLLVAGKTVSGLQELSRALKDRTMRKLYRCLTAGEISGDAVLSAYLKKDENRNRVMILDAPAEDAVSIRTGIHPLSYEQGLTYTEVELFTGKSHQIRAHLAHMGHPIIGDGKYGNAAVNQYYRENYGVTSQLLHAYRLVLANGREFVAKEPPVFRRILEGKKD